MPSYRDLAGYIKSVTPDLQNEDDKLVAEYAVDSFPNQFKREEFDWEENIPGGVEHPPQVLLPKNVAQPSITLPGEETESVEPVSITPPSKEEISADVRGLAQARDPLVTAGRVGLTAAGVTAQEAGKLYKRQPETDPEYEQRAVRGEQIALNNNLTPEQFSYQGDVPVIPEKITKTMLPAEREDLFTYLNKKRRENLSQMGTGFEQAGKKLVQTGEKIQPIKYREEEINRQITDIEQAHPSIATSFKQGDVSGALDGLLFDASLSGDDEAIKSAMELKRRYSGAAGRIEQEKEGEGFIGKTVKSTAEMLPMMGKGIALNAIPVAGQVLSGSMWARQGAGQILEDMYKAGIPKDVALPIALNAGIAYALVEQLQVGQVMNTGVKDAVKKPLMQQIKKIIADKGIDWVKENAEEVVQSIIQEKAFRDAAQAAGIDIDAAGIRKSYKELSWDTFKQSGGPLGLLSILGIGAGAGKATYQNIKGGQYAGGDGTQLEEGGGQEGVNREEAGGVYLRDDERARLEAKQGEEVIPVEAPEKRDRISTLADVLKVVKDKQERNQIIESMSDSEAKEILRRSQGIPTVETKKVSSEEAEEILAKAKEEEVAGIKIMQGTKYDRQNGEVLAEQLGDENVTFKAVQPGMVKDDKREPVRLLFNDETNGSTIAIKATDGIEELKKRIEENRAVSPEQNVENIAKELNLEPIGTKQAIGEAKGAGYTTETHYRYKTPEGTEITIKPGDTIERVKSYLERKQNEPEKMQTEVAPQPGVEGVKGERETVSLAKKPTKKDDLILNRYIKTGVSKGTTTQQIHNNMVDLINRADSNDIAEAVGITPEESQQAIADIKAEKNTEIAQKVRNAFAPNLMYGQSVDNVLKDISKVRTETGEVMFSKKENFKTIKKEEPKVIINLSDSQGRTLSYDGKLLRNGNIEIDGEQYDPNEGFYTYNKKAYKKPPKEMIENIQKSVNTGLGLGLYRDTYKYYKKARWNEIIPKQKIKGSEFDFFSEIENKKEIDEALSRKYGGLELGSAHQNRLKEMIEKIHDKIGNDATENEYYNVAKQIVAENELKNYYVKPNYLHFENENQNVDENIYDSVTLYRERGGKLGQSILKKYNKEEAKIAAAVRDIPYEETKEKEKPKLKIYNKENPDIRYSKKEQKPTSSKQTIEKVTSEEEKITNAVYKKNPNYGVIKIAQPNKKQQKLTEAFKESFPDKEIVWLDVNEDQLLKDVGETYNGFMLRKSDDPYLKNKIFINSKTEKPAEQIAYHELTHFIQDNPEYSAAFWDAAKLTKKGKELVARKGRDEAMADIASELMVDPEFQSELSKNKSVFKVIYDELVKILNKISEAFKKVTGKDTEGYVEDIESLRDTLKGIVQEYSGKTETDKQEVAFSKKEEPELIEVKKEPPIKGFSEKQIKEYEDSPLSVKYKKVNEADLPKIYEQAKTFDKGKKVKQIRKIYSDKNDSNILMRTMLGRKGGNRSRMLRTVSGRLLRISPEIRDQLQKHANGILIDTANAAKKVKPFLDALKKMPAADYKVFDIAAKNADSNKINELAKKYGFTKELKKYRNTFDDILTRLMEAGYETGYLKDYFPRMSKDKDAYRNYIRGKPDIGNIDEAIREREKKLGREMSDDEREEFLDLFIRGYGRGEDKPGNLKERKLMYIDNEANSLLEDTMSAIPIYLERMIKKAARKELFDPDAKNTDLEINNIDDSIGEYVQKLLKEKKIDPKTQDELIGLLKSFFNYRPTDKTFAAIKNMGFITSMGSGFSSMFSQMQDSAFGFYTAPGEEIGATLRSILGKSEINLEDLGVDTILGEFKDPGKMSNFMDKLFKGVGIKWGDSLFKNAFLDANLRKYRKMAKSGKLNKDFKTDLKNVFGGEAESVIEDLKNDVNSDNVKLLLLNQMSKFMPTTLLQVPQMYLDSPRGRIAYGLKTYQIAQVNAIMDEAIRGMKSATNVPDFKDAFKKVSGIIAVLLLSGIGTDKLKDFIFRRKANWGEYATDNLLKLALISRYTVWRARQDGITSTLLSLAAPPISWIDYIRKDVQKLIKNPRPEDFSFKNLETLRIIPVIGQEWYWWFGGGKEIQKRREKRQSTPAEYKRELRKLNAKISHYNMIGDNENRDKFIEKRKEFIDENREELKEYYDTETMKEYPREFSKIKELLNSDSKKDNLKARVKIKAMTEGQRRLWGKYVSEGK